MGLLNDTSNIDFSWHALGRTEDAERVARKQEYWKTAEKLVIALQYIKKRGQSMA